MSTLPSTTQRWIGLSPAHSDGVVCLWCDRSDRPLVPAGFSEHGPVFCCEPDSNPDGPSCSAMVRCLQLVNHDADCNPAPVIDLRQERAALAHTRRLMEAANTALRAANAALEAELGESDD